MNTNNHNKTRVENRAKVTKSYLGVKCAKYRPIITLLQT